MPRSEVKSYAPKENVMTDSRPALLRILARVRPQIWEVVGGLRCLHTHHFRPYLEQWKYGPLPDPWRAASDASWALSAQFSAIDLTRRLTDAASLIQAQGGDGPKFLSTLSEDDWCPLGEPIRLNFPPGWQHEWFEPPPRPNELDLLAVVATAGLSFTSLGDSIKDKDLGQAVVETGLKVLDMAAETGAKLELKTQGRL